MKISEMMKQLQTGRFKAIIKDVAGRRMFLGIERANKRSSKYHVKYMCPPQDLDQLVAKSSSAKATQPATESPTQ